MLPSNWEGMPNILLESHACGTPFVASAVGAIPQLARADQDELVAPGNRRQLADAIVRALQRGSGDAAMWCVCRRMGSDGGYARGSAVVGTRPTARHRPSGTPGCGRADSNAPASEPAPLRARVMTCWCGNVLPRGDERFAQAVGHHFRCQRASDAGRRRALPEPQIRRTHESR